jgi:hypothetical protein
LYFTPYEVASIANPRIRAILDGIVASDHEPAVYRAFQVLFEDLYPLRVAGRVIFKKLQSLTEASAVLQQRDIDIVVSETGLKPEQIQEMRLLFVSIASQLNAEMYITKQQLTTDPDFLRHVATNVMGLSDVEELFDYLFRNNTTSEKLEFCDLMVGLQSVVEETCGLDQCDPQEVLKQLFTILQEKLPLERAVKLDPERRKFNERYDEMVRSFVAWRHLIPQTGTGRRLDVVRGCFVGADNVKVVEALRTVYVDFSAFRFAGDIIFKLVSSVLKMRGASI